MIIRFFKLCALLVLAGAIVPISGQVDTVIGQVSQSTAPSFAGGISGNGRLVVFESSANLATENPRNQDLNREIFVFDYAQRRIFQITDTRPLLIEQVRAASGTVSLLSGSSGSVSGITVNGVQIMSGSVAFQTSLNQTATNVAANINAHTSSPNYTASVENNVITIKAAVTGPGPNGFVVEATATGITTSTTNLAGGFDGTGPVLTSNTKVEITNTRPVMSNDGRWIAFVSNATTSPSAGAPDGTNPGDFDANDYTDGNGNNVLTQDANLEVWLYQVPAVSEVDLSQGDELPVTNLAGGTFTQVTNSAASRLPVSGGPTQVPIIAADNTDPSISDDGNVVAFVSNRNLVGTGNQAPQDNPEIFTFVRGSSTLSQVTMTPRGSIAEPLYNATPTIAGTGMRVMFASNAQNPVVGMTGGNNSDLNEEVFYSDLDPSGAPSGSKVQVTVTSADEPGDLVNLVNFGRRMSRDGKYLAFDSFADLTNEHSGENQNGFATFLYDAATSTFQRIGPRSLADSAATGGDISRYPGFTDYDSSGTPQTLVLETRMNITPQGTIPQTAADGLNPDPTRPAQLYSFPIAGGSSAIFTRLTKLPAPAFFLGSTQPIPSDSLDRFVFSLPQSEIGTGNPDLSTEVYYLLIPEVSSVGTNPQMNFFTGATQIPVSNGPVPTPSPTPTPTATPTPTPTPTPSPTPTPTATPTPTPSPTPQTPPAVRGISRGMLAEVNYSARGVVPVVNKTAVGSFQRRFPLPMELGGVTMSINGVSVGLKELSQNKIVFVAPLGFGQNLETPLPVVINNNGFVIKGEITFVAFRPDIFRKPSAPGQNRAWILNVTNRVQTMEPFTVRTLRYKGGRKVDTRLRMYLTGVEGLPANLVSIQMGGTPVPSAQIANAVAIEPGLYSIDFSLGTQLNMAGDVPVTITILTSIGVFQGRLDSDAPRVRIL